MMLGGQLKRAEREEKKLSAKVTFIIDSLHRTLQERES